MKFVKLTKTDKTTVYVNLQHVTSIDDMRTYSVIKTTVSEAKADGIAVLETPEQILVSLPSVGG